MSFLSPLLLFGLPLALVPVVIHLIHLMRRKQVKWAAMMFLQAAQRMNKGLSRLRQYLILALRVLAVAALILVIGRPLAGGLLGLTGGAPDSVLILVDRSASMEQQLLTTGISKRASGLNNLSAALTEAYGKRSRLVLIDSATLKPVVLENAGVLTDLPQTGPTETSCDVPALLQGALDYITTNQTGRTDVWLLTDLRQTDWEPAGGRWATLRSAFATLPAVRFQVLAYPEAAPADLGVNVPKVVRRASTGKAELLMDIRIVRGEPVPEPVTVPLKVVINGVTSSLNAELKGDQVLLSGISIPVDVSTKRGWGRVELPADTTPADNVFHFVFDEPAPLKSVIVSDKAEVAEPLLAALRAPVDASRTYAADVLPLARAAEIEWEQTAMIVWQGSFPEPDSAMARQLENHVQEGRTLLFLPPDQPGSGTFSGVRWTSWNAGGPAETEDASLIGWWRNDAGLLAGTRAGSSLPVGETEVQRWCGLEGELIPLARLAESRARALLLGQAPRDAGGSVYFLATHPGAGSSTLARDGVVLFAVLHRALQEGSGSLGNARQKLAGPAVLGSDPAVWKPADESSGPALLPADLPLRAGVLRQDRSAPGSDPLLLALNRPPLEDQPAAVGEPVLGELFAGLEWRLIERSLAQEKSLTSEIWRTFLLLMAAALVLEALFCLPDRRTVSGSRAPAPQPA